MLLNEVALIYIYIYIYIYICIYIYVHTHIYEIIPLEIPAQDPTRPCRMYVFICISFNEMTNTSKCFPEFCESL